jgi:hypothetical protein
MPILKVLLILLLVLFPFGELIRFDLGNNIILKPMDITSALLFFWVVILYIKEKKFRSSLHWYFFYFPLIGLLSLGINSYWLKPNEILASFLYLLRWVSYMCIFFGVIQLKKEFRKKIILFLFIDGFIIVLIGFLQFFFYPSLKNLYYLGWDNHLYRLFSSFLDPNFVGAFFVLYLIFISGFLFIREKEKNYKLVTKSLLLVLTLIATFLTYSRSALLMLISSSTAFFIYLQRKKFIIYLLVIIGIFIILASPFFYLENINLFRPNSSLERVADIMKGITIFRDHPLIGVGFDSYRYAQYRYNYENPVTPNPVHDASGIDNSFVFILATTGVFGFIAYCFMWFKLYKKAKKKKNRYSVIFIASAIGLFCNSLFNNSLFYSEIMIWMWFITSFVYTKD